MLDKVSDVARNVFIVRWNGWRRFARDFSVIQIGFLLFGLSINITVYANIGVGPWTVLEKGLTSHLPISLGQASVFVAVVVILLDMLLGEPLGWGTVSNMIFVGLWVDLVRPYVPQVPDIMWVQIAYLLLGTLLMGFATAIYVGVNAGAGPRDSLMMATSRIAGVSVRLARTFIEITVVFIGWLLGGPAWFGTIVFAAAIGPAVQLAFRLLNVRPEYA